MRNASEPGEQRLPTDATHPAQDLRAAVVRALQQALDEPVLPASDSSLRDIEWTCRCKDCGQVVAWAESAGAQPLVLAMAETRRAHVQSRVQETGAALDAETLKQGSPYKLVLPSRGQRNSPPCAAQAAGAAPARREA